MTQQHPLIKLVNSTSLVSQILVGLVFGILLAMFMPEWAKAAGLLGSLFVGALKAVAPLLVFVLVMSAIIGHKQGQKTNMKPILLLYLLALPFHLLGWLVFVRGIQAFGRQKG